MSQFYTGKTDDELRSLGCMVIGERGGDGCFGATAEALSWLLLGTGPIEDGDKRDSGPEWQSMPVERRLYLLRLDRWCALIPNLPAGEARALALDPQLTVLDKKNDRIILLPGRRAVKGP